MCYDNLLELERFLCRQTFQYYLGLLILIAISFVFRGINVLITYSMITYYDLLAHLTHFP